MGLRHVFVGNGRQKSYFFIFLVSNVGVVKQGVYTYFVGYVVVRKDSNGIHLYVGAVTLMLQFAALRLGFSVALCWGIPRQDDLYVPCSQRGSCVCIYLWTGEG